MNNFSCENLVSIIMPSYNSSEWIEEAIDSVQAQTYKDWELIISDDSSKDDTVRIAEIKAKGDSRITVIKSEQNCGAGVARNKALDISKGRYIAFLDSDDVWKPDKLQIQLEYMKSHGYAMCYTDYDIINDDGKFRKVIHVPHKVTYHSYLQKPITCTLSIVLDTKIIDKELIRMPDIKRGQDGATWLQILKTDVVGYGLDKSLAMYRRHKGSLSNNKFKAAKRVWFLYRKVEKLSFWYSCRCFLSYAINAIKKYI